VQHTKREQCDGGRQAEEHIDDVIGVAIHAHAVPFRLVGNKNRLPVKVAGCDSRAPQTGLRWPGATDHRTDIAIERETSRHARLPDASFLLFNLSRFLGFAENMPQ
jgi:hypothetical protein